MNRDALINQLLSDEGLRLKPYKDTVNKLTIGVGRNLDDVGISKDEAMFLLGNDLRRVYAEVTNAMPWLSSLDDARQNVLLNMAFNMGINKLLGFKNTLGLIRRGEYSQAAEEMLNSEWAKQVGARAKRLSTVMRTGVL